MTFFNPTPPIALEIQGKNIFHQSAQLNKNQITFPIIGFNQKFNFFNFLDLWLPSKYWNAFPALFLTLFASTFTKESLKKSVKLDWESIRSSPRDGFGVVGTLGFWD